MKTKTIVASLLLASLYACGGDSAQSWEDAPSAIEAGDQANAAKDSATAIQAFSWAAENAGGNGQVLFAALMGLGEAQTKNDPEAAIAAFKRAQTECGSAYDFFASQRVIDAWLNAGVVELAEEAINNSASTFPGDAQKLESQKKALAALISGDTEALSALGYVGD